MTTLSLEDWCKQLRKIRNVIPSLWTTADLVRLRGDAPDMAVHMTRALRKAGFESVPPGNKKVRGLIDRATAKEVQSYVWRLASTKLPQMLSTVAGVREQYNDQPRRLKELEVIARLRQHVQQKLASARPRSPKTRPQHVS